jgi:hypothetical protein
LQIYEDGIDRRGHFAQSGRLAPALLQNSVSQTMISESNSGNVEGIRQRSVDVPAANCLLCKTEIAITRYIVPGAV